MIPLAERQQIVQWINSALATGARLYRACVIIGLSSRALQRWNKPDLIQIDRHTHSALFTE
ncbi:MAG: hypothetical protein WC856_28335 [Methylococcaceae bacterium]|jgi:hypothetical protein